MARSVAVSQGIPLDLYRREMQRRGLARDTIEKRASLYRRFRRWLGRPIVTASEEEVQGFLDGLEIGVCARYRYISDLHTFYVWAVRAGHAKGDPTAEIVRPKLPRRLPRPMSDEDLAWAMAAADDRMRLWLALANFAGLRCVEMAGLVGERVHLDDNPPWLHIVGKGATERVVPVNPIVESALRAYGVPRTGPLFYGVRSGRPLTAANISLYIARYLHDRGLSVTAHQGRHAFGTNIYQSTGDLRLTQELLGHADPSTTAIYTKVDTRKGWEAIRRLGQVAQPGLFDHTLAEGWREGDRDEVSGDGRVRRGG